MKFVIAAPIFIALGILWVRGMFFSKPLPKDDADMQTFGM